MDTKGRLISISKDWKTGKFQVAFEIDHYDPDAHEDLTGDLAITAGKWRDKRSRSANALFHKVCGMIAHEKTVRGLPTSMAREKNTLISKYGQPLYFDGDRAVYKTNAPEEYMRELDRPHTKFLKTGADGAHWYLLYRNSSEYDSKEMAALISGAIADATEWGITVGEDQAYIDHLCETWGGNRHEG